MRPTKIKGFAKIMLLTFGALSTGGSTYYLLKRLLREFDSLDNYETQLGKAFDHIYEESTIPSEQILEGSPKFRSIIFGAAVTGENMTGIWECTGPARFRWDYSVDESIYVLEGEATLSYFGKVYSLQAGQSAKFLAGTSAEWNVSRFIKKSWAVYNISTYDTLIRLFRPLFFTRSAGEKKLEAVAD